MSVDPGAMPFSLDALFFESALPTDGRIHSVDVRDAAAAFAAATTADVVGEILLIGGDESHLLRQGDVGKALAAARGLVDVLPGGRPGDPDSDDDWFVTDWMDTTRAQQALSFQQHILAGHAGRDACRRRLATLPDAVGRSARPPRFSNAVPPTGIRPGTTPTRGRAIRAKLGDPRPDIRERLTVS